MAVNNLTEIRQIQQSQATAEQNARQRVELIPLDRQGNETQQRIVFDCTVQMDPVYEAEPTSLPIESGSTIADHTIDHPTRLEMQIVHSDHPLDDEQAPDPARASQLLASLIRLQKERLLCNVLTPKSIFGNMFLSSVRPTVNSDTSQGVVAQLSFQQVNTVETKRVVLVKNADDSAKGTVKKGQVQTKPATPQEDDNASLLYTAFGGG